MPREWSPARRWPVVLFLHGAGERGEDGRRQTEVGLPSAIRRALAPDSAIVVMPQAADGRRWFLDMADVAMAALDSATLEFHGDPDRTYLTGMSMGGQGAWFLAMRHPDVVDRLVVASGGFDSSEEEIPDIDAAVEGTVRFLGPTYGEVSPDGEDHFAVVTRKDFELSTREPRWTEADLGTIGARTLVLSTDPGEAQTELASLRTAQRLLRIAPSVRTTEALEQLATVAGVRSAQEVVRWGAVRFAEQYAAGDDALRAEALQIAARAKSQASMAASSMLTGTSTIRFSRVVRPISASTMSCGKPRSAAMPRIRASW